MVEFCGTSAGDWATRQRNMGRTSTKGKSGKKPSGDAYPSAKRTSSYSIGKRLEAENLAFRALCMNDPRTISQAAMHMINADETTAAINLMRIASSLVPLSSEMPFVQIESDPHGSLDKEAAADERSRMQAQCLP